jgi:hypothetical protein
MAKRGNYAANLKIRHLFAGAALVVDVLPCFFHLILIVGHQTQFIFDMGVVVRLDSRICRTNSEPSSFGGSIVSSREKGSS